jgi:dipeptidyl aminopeptidase/acylaminoacyl peptidase
MVRWCFWVSMAACAACFAMNSPQVVQAQGPAVEAPLIPRAKFFGNPEKARARLSHDGKRLAFVAPVEGVLNVWVSSDDNPANAKPITFDKHRGVVNFMWAYTNKHILYTQDKNGDEDNHVYVIDLESGKITDLTPIEKIAAQLEGFSENFPEEILVGINDRDERHYHDIYRINITTADKKLVKLNPGFAGFLIDDNYDVRLAMNFSPTGGQIYLQPDGKEGWKPFMEIGVSDAMTTSPVGFNKEANKLYMLDSRGRNTAALKLMPLAGGETELIAESPRADISGALAHPTKKTVQAVSYTFTRTEWKILDPSIQPDFDYLKTVADGELQITGRTLDDKRWTVAYLMDNGPVQFYIYDRAPNRKVTYLFSSNRELEKLPLVKMHPQVIKSRDGLELVSYLTLPHGTDPDGDGRPDRPLPMVLNVHGGPWARDDWGYDPEHQLLANRGYAVLAVNYRGSTGFGKEFINAADKEWAGKMHNDLIDAVNWAVDNKVARKDKVAIMGGSYGGYATLVGLTFTPDVFACGVDVVGPSSLITLLSNPPPYWMPFMPVMKVRVGDHQSDEGKKFLESRSPLFLVDKIQRPLLIGQGANDPRVKQPEADQIVKAMNERMIPVTYVLFHDEGHGFSRPQNRFAFYAITEAFLAQNLGGRFEPIGEAFTGADFSVPSGENQVPGLADKLKARSASEK